MFRSMLPALAACCTLLFVGCANLSAPPDEAAPAVTQPPEADTGFDWLSARDRAATAIGAMSAIEVRTMDDGALLLRLPAADGFAPGETAPSQQLRAMLDHAAQTLAQLPDTEVRVLGHTDSLGSELHNLRLSIQRAETVMDYLRSRGISLGRLMADGRGEAEPIDDNNTEAGRTRNRRVELIVRPFH